MLFRPNEEQRLCRLQEQLACAKVVTPELVADIAAEAYADIVTLGARAKLDRLIESNAWMDAALALIEIALPRWVLRRLIYEEGEWLCSLSRQPRLPAGLDPTAEASHQILPLAILGAFLQARRDGSVSLACNAPLVPQVGPARGHVLCCDNFC